MRDEQERRTGGMNRKQTNRRMTTGEEALWTLVKTETIQIQLQNPYQRAVSTYKKKEKKRI